MGGYRLKCIEVMRSAAIDQIKFIYDDDTSWTCGHDGGKRDSQVAIMTPGEYLVRVSHERFENHTYAGAAVEFETNKGRTFKYHTRRMTTMDPSQVVTIQANPNHEIISLEIRHGVLLGVKQQLVPQDEQQPQPKEWYTLALFDNNDGQPVDDLDDDVSCSLQHFHSRRQAMAGWRQATQRSNILPNTCFAAILFNTRKRVLVKKRGASTHVKRLLQSAATKGISLNTIDEDVSITRIIRTLLRVIGSKGDIINMVVVTSLLILSGYLELCTELMTGQLFSLFGLRDTPQGDEQTHNFNFYTNNTVTLYTNASNVFPQEKQFSRQQSYWITDLVCDHVLPCEDLYSERVAFIATFVVVHLLSQLAYVLNVFLHHRECDSKNIEIRKVVFAKVLSLDQTYFDTHAISQIRSGMDVDKLTDFVTWNLPYLVMFACRLLLCVYFLCSINLYLGSICVLSMILIKCGILDWVAKKHRTVIRIERKCDRRAREIEDETLDMITPIKVFGSDSLHQNDLGQAMNMQLSVLDRVVILRCFREFGFGSMKAVTFGIVLYLALNEISQSSLSTSDITAFFLIFSQFFQLFERVKWHLDLLPEQLPGIERVLDLMAATSSMENGKVELTNVQGEVVFDDVTFEYPSRPGHKAVDKLSLRIAPHKTTAIVGDSGAGKSTITKLLLRLYDPEKGSVSIDGHDLRDLEWTSFRNKIAVVSQNPELFQGTLRDNIAYGAVDQDNVTDDEVDRAVALANCTEFIKGFRAGLDTFAGRRGLQLSGGQKQRIAIARAAIRDPSVLILDEATSALDAENEYLVQQALENLMKNRTTIVIAHRLCTVKSADEIVCMKQGRVVERGTHDDLMKLRGAYYKLVSTQLIAGEH
jgi:subfamily B ATP-binding cassette protein MsbA